MPASRQSQRTDHMPAAVVTFSQTLLLATDLQKSILTVLDHNGPCSLVYSTYGLQSGPLAAGTRLGFNGQLKELPTDCYYLGNGRRVYNPTLMRFHSPDRLSPFDKGGLNAYAYCAGDPVNFEDPTGQFISAFISWIGTFEAVAGHIENVATAFFRSRPRGVLGYASVTSNVGYAGMTTGAAMQVAGYPAGVAVSNVGAALVSAGNGVKAAHSAVQVFKGSRLGRAITRRNTIKYAPAQGLNEVIVEQTPTSGRERVRTPAARNPQPAALKIRKG